VTQLLQAAANGDSRAAADLLPMLYQELRRLAAAWMEKTPPGQTLQPTALVHEAYIRLVGKDALRYENRRHFFFVAARAMRDILVEQARRKASKKRGGDRRRIDAANLILAIEVPAEDMLALDDALEKLRTVDDKKHELVMLRFFAGLTVQETAEVMGISVSTVEREWRYIRARLHLALSPDEPHK
jgi:RNA polymerase sigma factor (TIGR02999 family)